MVSKELESESIIVFDEAHNIDSVCIEALSVTINDRGLEQATRSLGRLSSEVSRLKATDSQRLQQEYQNLVNGLIDQGLLEAPANDRALGSVRPFCFGVRVFVRAGRDILPIQRISIECPQPRRCERSCTW
jgi:Rad3-related DNA helicase